MSSQKKKGSGSEGERKRREHAAKILSGQSGNDEREFICSPVFQNSLPNVPSGPFFRTIELPHSSADFALYSVSTLEKTFIWQPHQVGLNLELVDQDSILSLSDKSVHAADARFLADRRANSNIPERIPWLKRTTYLTNDLYDNVNKFKGGEALEKGFKERKLQSTGDRNNPFDPNFISRSFDIIPTKTKELLEKESKPSKRSVEWILPIFPDQDSVWSQNLSLVSFAEDVNDIPLLGQEDLIPEEVQWKKKQRMTQSVVTNIRRVEGREEVAASVVVPIDLDKPTEEYEWLKDFKMDIKASKLLDHFELTFLPDRGECVYCPLRAKIEMKKIDPKFTLPHRATITRRDALPSEQHEKQNFLSEIRE